MQSHIPWIQSALYFLMNGILTDCGFPKISEMFLTFKDVWSLFVFWFCPHNVPETRTHEHTHATQHSILDQSRYWAVGSVFLLTLCLLSPSVLTLLAYIRIWQKRVPFNLKPFWFTWTLLMPYSTVNLKSNEDKTLLLPDKCLSTFPLM
jgi:hypothetical protein